MQFHDPKKHLHLLDNFYVITMISNPIRYKTRYELYKRFEKMVLDAGATLVTVEIAFGEREFEITDSQNTNHIQLRTIDELWIKENALNIAISRLPIDWKYVAWVDADIHFSRPDWLIETVHQLQHYHVVQMWSHCHDLGPQFEPMQVHESFMYRYHQNSCQPPQGAGFGGYYTPKNSFWHSGFAWAATRHAIDSLSGLLSIGILGSGDHHMALCLISQGHRSIPNGVGSRYLKEILKWQDRCKRYIKKDVGYVAGSIFHWFHGKKKDRKYKERWDIITGNNFDPDTDIKKDSQGLYQLEDNSERQIKLRDEIRAYFRQRNEDSIDL